jgi:tetratricopeptide (TPR) repeat protein
MRIIIYLFLTITASIPSSRAFSNTSQNTTQTELTVAVNAYNDSLALGQKADTFLHARSAYKLAQKLYSNSPSNLTPYLHRYAVAAATYREPVALSLFKQTLDLLVQTYDANAIELALPLVDAADEALSRNEPQMAYAWYDKARDLIERDQPNGSIELARAYMGLARMYLNSGEDERAQSKAEDAIKLLNQHYNQASPNTVANLYYWLGKVKKEVGTNNEALAAYTTSLDIFLAQNPRERKVLTIHKNLVEINHKLNRIDDAVLHCIKAQKWQNQRDMGIWWPVYDPSGRLEHDNKIKIGQILFAYTPSNDCKAHDIEIFKTVGISPEEAERLIGQAYFAPRLRNGELAQDQRVEQTNIDVYEP